MPRLRISLPSPALPVIFRAGWREAETFGRRTAGPTAEVLIVLPATVCAPLRIELELRRPAPEAARLKVNGADVGLSDSGLNPNGLTWSIGELAQDRILRLELSSGLIGDPIGAVSRPLGLAVTAISLEADAAPDRLVVPVRSALMCKSFAPDLERFEVLVRSILDHDQSGLRLVVCVPHADLADFRRVVPASALLIAEEEFVEPRCFDWLDGWRQQQVVKLAFYRLGLCDRYLAIDSDCYFIRPFSEEDVFGPPDEIRVVAQTAERDHGYGALGGDNNLVLGLTARSTYSSAKVDFRPDPLKIPEGFLHDLNYKNCPPDLAWSLIPYAFSADYPARRITCLPPPMLFCAEILAALDLMISGQGLSFVDLIHLSPWEADWYGHFALKYYAERIRTVSPMFVHFTTDEQLAAARQAGVTHKTLARNFLGVNLAARHQSDLQL